jgi:hypothetical protein
MWYGHSTSLSLEFPRYRSALDFMAAWTKALELQDRPQLFADEQAGLRAHFERQNQ